MNLSSTGSTVANFDTNFECTFTFEPQHSLLIGARDDLSRNWRALDILVDPCESEVVGCLFGTSCNINNAGLDTDMDKCSALR